MTLIATNPTTPPPVAIERAGRLYRLTAVTRHGAQQVATYTEHK